MLDHLALGFDGGEGEVLHGGTKVTRDFFFDHVLEGFFVEVVVSQGNFEAVFWDGGAEGLDESFFVASESFGGGTDFFAD